MGLVKVQLKVRLRKKIECTLLAEIRERYADERINHVYEALLLLLLLEKLIDMPVVPISRRHSTRAWEAGRWGVEGRGTWNLLIFCRCLFWFIYFVVAVVVVVVILAVCGSIYYYNLGSNFYKLQISQLVYVQAEISSFFFFFFIFFILEK